MAALVNASRAIFEAAPRKSSTPYVCQSCRRAIFTQTAVSSQRRDISNHSFASIEIFPRKIWKRNKPVQTSYGYDKTCVLGRRRMATNADIGDAKEGPRLDQKRFLSQDRHTEPIESENSDLSTESVEPEPYRPASTWDGLEHIGHTGDWRHIEPAERDNFVSFVGHVSRKAANRQELLSCLHQAVVEVSLLGREAVKLGNKARSLEYLDAVFNCRLVTSPDTGTIDLEWPSDTAPTIILQANEGGSEDAVDAVPEDQSFLAPPPGDLLSLPLSFHTSEFHFQILKRFTQLSGHHIPDPILNSSRDMGSLLDAMTTTVVQPKPKKLAHRLMEDENLTALPNLRIKDRRHTPVDREKEVGRWKIIEEELRERGLPVLGRPS